MQQLDIEPKTVPKQRPASEYPASADVYVCDLCGRDVTAHLWQKRGHGGPPLGPSTYRCACGGIYLTGKREWDQLGDSGRRSWFGDIGLGFVLAGLAGVFWAVVYALFCVCSHFMPTQRGVFLFLALIVAFTPAVPLLILIAGTFAIPFQIAASIWRTRFRESSHLN